MFLDGGWGIFSEVAQEIDSLGMKAWSETGGGDESCVQKAVAEEGWVVVLEDGGFGGGESAEGDGDAGENETEREAVKEAEWTFVENED
jgi:hypothetical protein